MKYQNGKMSDVQIAYIGGGSRGWAWTFMTDLALEPDVYKRQMRLRNSHPAFSETSQMTFLVQNNQIHIMWKKDQFKLTLEADLKTLEWKIY